MYEDPVIYNTTYTTTTQPEINPIVWVVWLVVVIFMIAAMWRIYTKAGKPGWAAIIPIYNYVVMLEIVGRPIWWIILMLIPGVNFIVGIIVLHDLSKSFGKGVGMTLLNVFLPIVGYPVLAWGDAQYVGPSAQANAAVPPVQNTNNPPQTPAV